MSWSLKCSAETDRIPPSVAVKGAIVLDQFAQLAKTIIWAEEKEDPLVAYFLVILGDRSSSF
jgi:hypothetical protein